MRLFLYNYFMRSTLTYEPDITFTAEVFVLYVQRPTISNCCPFSITNVIDPTKSTLFVAV